MVFGISSYKFDIHAAFAPLISSLPNHTSIYHKWPRENLRTTLPDYISLFTTTIPDINKNYTFEDSITLMGTPIHVFEGDKIEILLTNYLQTAGLSLHFHGFEMQKSLMYDGVVGITQCSVSPFESFLYNFTVDEVPGTYWYHTHSGLLGLDGYNAIKGPLIVHSKNSHNLDSIVRINNNQLSVADSSLLSYGNERILFFSDGSLLSESTLYANIIGGSNPPVSKNEDGFTVGTQDYDFGTCNGKLREVIHVVPNKMYKLRLINGGSHYAFRISIDYVPMTIIAADSEQVQPREVDEVILHAGERFDVEIFIPPEMKDGERFWIRADTLESKIQGYQNGVRAILNVVQTEDSYPLSTSILDPVDDIINSPKRLEDRNTMNCYSRYESESTGHQGSCLKITDLKPFPLKSQKDSNTPKLTSAAEFHTVEFEFSPAPLHAHFVRIDGGLYIQHENPLKPMLDPTFDYRYDSHPNTAMMHVSPHTTAIIIWKNKSLMDHPMHLHGYKMEILDVFIPTRRKDCTLSKCKLSAEFNLQDSETVKKLESIPFGSRVLKDTFILPAGGAVATRIHTAEPAVWFAHCHLKMHSEDGMAFILNVGNYTPPSNKTSLPNDFPSCSTPFQKSRRKRPFCHCYVNKDAVLDGALTENHRCSRDHLCFQEKSKAANLDKYRSSGSWIGSKYHIPNWSIFVIVASFIFIITSICKKIEITNRNNLSAGDHGPNKTRSHSKLRYEISKEWKLYFPGCINYLRVFEVMGLATLTGYLFYDVGNNPTAIGLSEKYSLLFFSLTLWTFTRMYPAVSNYNNWLKSHLSNCDKNYTGSDAVRWCISKCIVVIGSEAWWPMIYCFVCFPLAGMFQHVSAIIIISIFLALNTICYVALGGALGVSFDVIPLGMSMSTIISQTSLVAAGFYTQLPSLMSWIRYVSPVFWTYRGVLKSALRWSDTYSCVKGQSDIGSNECYLEFNPGIDALKKRGINVASFNDRNNGVLLELFMLCILFLALQIYTFFLVAISTRRKFQSNESNQKSSDLPELGDTEQTRMEV